MELLPHLELYFSERMHNGDNGHKRNKKFNKETATEVTNDQPLHSSSVEQSALLHHGKVVPKEHSAHHAMACEDIFHDPIHLSLYLPKSLVQIP